jgi:hypothetical protein
MPRRTFGKGDLVMQPLSCHGERRRSQRIPLIVPLVISNLSSRFPFSEYTKTRQVSRYGFQVRTARPLTVGTQVRLDVLGDEDSRTATARVIHSEPVRLHNDIKLWNSGLALDQPGNIWWVIAASEGRPAGHRQPVTQGGASAETKPERSLHPLDRAALYPMPSAPASETRRHHTSSGAGRMTHATRSWVRPVRGDGPPLRLLRVAAQGDEPGLRRLDSAPQPQPAGPAPTGATDSLEQEWEQAATALKTHLVGLESRLEQVTADLDAGFPARVQRVVADAVGRLREQLEHRLNDLIHDAMLSNGRQGRAGVQAEPGTSRIGLVGQAHPEEASAVSRRDDLAGAAHASLCKSGRRGQ